MTQTTEFVGTRVDGAQVDFARTDYEAMADELGQMELCSQKEALRVEIDSSLQAKLKELETLQAQLPKEQSQRLFEQCAQNAIDAVVGHFGLGAVVLNAQDGGNVSTTHNARQGIYASEKERQAYENRGEYSGDDYHKDKAYRDINREQSAAKKAGQATDYMTGERLARNAKTDLDHKVSAKTIHDDRARVLAEVDGVELANTWDNLAITDRALNRSKKAMSADEFIAHKERSLAELEKNSKEMERKAKFEAIDDDKLRADYAKSKENIDNKVDKAYYTSAKPYKEALATGTRDAGKMAIHSAIGVILKEFIEGMAIELKTLFKEFGNESLKDIFKRFAARLGKIWEKLRAKWKDIIKGSFEAGIVAFFSNLVVFAINIVFTTLKKFVQIIRAGFASLCEAGKKLFDKSIPKDERINAAAKVFVAGIISTFAMLGAEFITKWLYSIPPLTPILAVPLPFLNETIGDALGLCISAALGAVLSTIAIYYIDKFASQNKESKIQLQIMTKTGEIVNFQIQRTWLLFSDGFDALANMADGFGDSITQTKKAISKSGVDADTALDAWENELKELENLMKGQK